MLVAFLWAAVASSSMLLGGMLACQWPLSRRSLGLLMAFGAGTLLSAVSFELVFEAVRRSRGSGVPALGFFAGALVFYFSDQLIEAWELRHRRRGAGRAAAAGSLAVPMVLGIVLDGIPESVVIGLGVLEHRAVSLSLLVAVFLSNLPEAVAGTVGMRQDGWGRRPILLLWAGIALVCAAASGFGYSLFSQASGQWLSLIQAFAGGAILVMLANSMIPESYEHSGKLAGLLTVLGFFSSVAIVLFEAAQNAG